MANNYCESSSMLEIPNDKQDKAQEIIDQFIASCEQDESGCFNGQVSVEGNGVWIRHEESIDVEQAADLAQALVDGLEIDEPFQFSWSYTCSKRRIDEFGGGSCIIRRGKAPIWVDAVSTAREIMEKEENTPIC